MSQSVNLSKFKAGLVGAGYICEYHVKALRRAGIDIVGVTDLDPDRLKNTAERLSIRTLPSPAALREAGASVLHVLTPPHAHAPVTLQALELGCHALVEKPLAESVEDCQRIEEASKRTGLQVCVNHSLLYDPHVRGALDMVRSGKLGRIVSVDILRSSAYPPYGGGPLPPQYRAAGYPFRDLGVHALYLFQAFLGPIENIDAQWASLGGDPNLAYDEWRAMVRCKGGLGQLQLSWNVRPLQSQIIIQGTRGVLRVDLFLMFHALRAAMPVPKAAERVFNTFSDSLRPLLSVPKNVAGVLLKRILPYHGLQLLVEDFYHHLAEGKPAPVPVSDATPVVQWTEQVATAADKQHQRRLSELRTSDRVPYLVTGASGAVGSAVVDRLLGQGHRVRTLVRRIPDRIRPGVEVVVGDLGDPTAVDRAVRGADVVIHAGAAMKGGWVEHQAATITGTKNVLESCRRHGVSKLVHVSSMSVIDWAGGDHAKPVTESTPFEPKAEARGHYTRAKLEAERLVTQFVRETGLPTVILRPGQIYGGKIPLLTPAVARRMGKRWLVLGGGDVRLPLVHMDDVVDAILAAAASDLRGGEVLQIVGPETPTQNEVLAQTLGKDAKVLRVPRPIVFSLGKLSEWMLAPLKRPSPLSAYRLRSALVRRTFASEMVGPDGPLLLWQPRIHVGLPPVPATEPITERPKTTGTVDAA